MMIRLLVLILLIGSALSGVAQRSSNPKVNKGLQKVQSLANAGKTAKSKKYLTKLASKYPDDLAIMNKQALGYLNQEHYKEAIPLLQKLAEANPDKLTYWYTLYDTSMKTGDFDQAKEYLNTAISKVDPDSDQHNKITRDLANLQFAREAMQNPVDFNPVRWDEEVNSAHLEYLPSVAIDGTVIFTRRQNGVEDLYMTHRDTSGAFSTPEVIDFGNINGNVGAHFLSTDGQTLMVSIDDPRKGYGSYDIFYTRKINGKWGQLKNLGKTVNSSKSEIQPNLSADGKELYFVSNRSGGMGGTDIYLSRLENNQWTTPVALGPNFNTALNEESPFIHPDGKTFYYRSDGRVGMGDFDIYVLRNEDGEWGEPTNIGYPINTETSEGALFVDIHGQKAYYASDAGLDNLDIFEFDLPYAYRPDPVTYVLLKVFDSDTDQPLDASVSIVDLGSGEEFKLLTSSSTGEQSQILDTGNSYAITVMRDGYAFYSAHVDLEDEASAEVPYQYTIGLEPIRVVEETRKEVKPEPILLSNIFFNSGKDILLPESATEIQNLVNLLNENQSISIVINGHTDNVGSESDNLELSERRAKAVYEAVVGKGIDQARLAYQGYGESVPIADNDTEEGRSQNRRTEFVIINE